MIRSIDPSITVKHACSGALALASLEENPADLILLDLVMAGMDGWHVIDALRKAGKMEDTQIVIVSAQDPVAPPPVTRYLLGATRHGLELDGLVTCSLHLAKLLETV